MTTMDQIHRIRELFYEQGKNLNEIAMWHIGVRPHKEKINISKEIINKTRGAAAPCAARMNHTPLRGEQQATVL